VAVAVRDTGEGIPAEDLPRVFTKFFRATTVAPPAPASGCGSARGLVEAHGGSPHASLRRRRGEHLPVHAPTDAFERELGTEPIGEQPS
jgi:K+-sensing histidine kinase KdpD